ncbi:MAG: DUF4346 domain-containing protein [Chloroflexi bacterium]|uniref:DUF4346 domain-containing protein n=1 Tax=Candidatus Chlorohelix allophototropha TaxID=3003348 RepID=A0A8T7LYT9_9CHLR|nr:DUF4346 domain-containing protein [Chloroflexota bacterium]WJW66538.1 thymidylate synthase [Chloroflexota bacterium L227-S17]
MTAELGATYNLTDLISYKDLQIGNPESNVGICTLWTQRHLIAQKLDTADYFICANLYSFAGINLMARNIFMFPQIRYLILCGADQSSTGEALASFFAKGLGANHTIPGTQAKLDEGIPLEAWEELRQQVQLIDLRPAKGYPKNPEAIAEQIKLELAKLATLPPFAEPRTFPELAPEGGKALPSERTGFRVQGETVAETWLEVMQLVMRFGQIKPTEYSQQQREIYNTVAVITDENPDDIVWADYLPFSRAELENYYPKILSAEKEPGIAYTYGERLRSFGEEGHDQIARMKERLREAHHTRRAVAVTWDVEQDSVGDNPPCLLEVSAGVQDGALYMTARFRSHDIYTAWAQNTYALRKLQKEIADDTGLRLGALTIISHSAHIYADKWKFALDTIDSFKKRRLDWRSDPRGYFIIELERERSLIKVQHSTIEGNTPYYFEGKTARQLCLLIAHEKLASLEEHYSYLGRELQKAEIALKLGLNYTQDKELEFN